MLQKCEHLKVSLNHPKFLDFYGLLATAKNQNTKELMKKYIISFALLIICFSCGEEEVQNDNNDTLKGRYPTDFVFAGDHVDDIIFTKAQLEKMIDAHEVEDAQPTTEHTVVSPLQWANAFVGGLVTHNCVRKRNINITNVNLMGIYALAL